MRGLNREVFLSGVLRSAFAAATIDVPPVDGELPNRPESTLHRHRRYAMLGPRGPAMRGNATSGLDGSGRRSIDRTAGVAL